MESTDALVWDTNGEVPANFPKISYHTQLTRW